MNEQTETGNNCRFYCQSSPTYTVTRWTDTELHVNFYDLMINGVHEGRFTSLEDLISRISLSISSM